MTNQYAHITVTIHTALFKKLSLHLEKLGIGNLYAVYGRSMLLNESRGLTSLFRSSDLLVEAVEVVYFYLPLELEQPVMKSIIHHCRLDIPGRGSIYSRHIEVQQGQLENLLCTLTPEERTALLSLETNTQSAPLFSKLVQIQCAMSKGLADNVSRLLLHIGFVPTITNASGTGLRDQLGLLRITIPKQKELLSVVVGQHESSSVMDKIISWGKLDLPGRGFIWQIPIEKGLINFKTYQKSIGQAASTEQIIAAIDSLKGNYFWRQGGAFVEAQTKRDYFKAIELVIQVNEGQSLPIAKAMIKLGISGATVQDLKTLSLDTEEEIVAPQEVVRVVVTEAQARKFFAAVESAPTDDNMKFLSTVQILKHRVIRAFNYRRPS